MSTNILDRFTSIDNKQEVTNQDLQTIAKLLRAIAQKNGVSSKKNKEASNSETLLLFPSPTKPPAKIQNVNPQDLVATIPRGLTKIKYTGGTVDIPGRSTYDLNNKLLGLENDYVHSISITSDNHIWWFVPDETVGGYIDQFRETNLTNIRAKEMWMFAFMPTTISMYASTSNRIGAISTSPQRSMERVTSDGTQNGVEISVSYSSSSNQADWTPLEWTNEENILSSNPQPLSPLHTMNIAQLGCVIRNTGNNPIEIAARVKETIYGNHPADNIIGWGPLPNYTGSNPEEIQPGNAKVLSWSNWGHHFIEFNCRAKNSNTSSSVAASFLGKTG